VRVRVDRLDRLINLAGELAMDRQVQAAHVQTLNELQVLLIQHERQLAELTDELARLRFSPTQRQLLDQRAAALAGTSNRARHLLRAQAERMATHNDHHALLVGDLEQEVMAARLLPVSTVFANLPRAVRELSTALGKEVALRVEGETTELDRKLLEALNDPLIHLVRNALDHGIEPPAERIAAGKPAAGQLTVAASATGGEVHLVIGDDGRGMDPQRLRESAVRKGLIGKEAAALLSDQEALELVFLPGFSTAPIITDVSGRGVGMDVVRTNISELGGQALIESLPGAGTTITLVLPLTLVTSRVLLVELAERTFALPASGCRSIIWTRADDLRSIEGQALITYDDRSVPLLRLADLLEVEGKATLETAARVPTVLIGSAKRPLGLLVDRLYDEREVVVKPLGPLFERRRRYSGAIQLGDGRLVLLLNPVALSQEARGMAVAAPGARGAARSRPRLLVADDSFTTRELIRSILQSAGYDVTVAVDGHDALDKLRVQLYDLVVSDVEMPRVNGFQLTARIRQELQLADLPVIIITSLASDAHRRQGLEAGAQAYIVKSQFDQDNLLVTVRQLLGR
jgi:two-component system chemotaxis sensor kinase CheA